MRAFLPAILLILIVLVGASTASYQYMDEMMDHKTWQDLKKDLAQTKKDMISYMAKTKRVVIREMFKRDQHIQKNYNAALDEVEKKIDQTEKD